MTFEEWINEDSDMIKRIADSNDIMWQLQQAYSAGQKNASTTSVPLDLLVSGDTAEVKAKYNELIMAVANKWPGETRHETALRYIRQAETSSNQACAASSD